MKADALTEANRARLIAAFESQGMMRSLGIVLKDLAPGKARFEMPFDERFSQQHGFMHAGAITTALDSACGFAAFSLMPEDAEVLTVELKVSLMAPARGERFLIEGEVIKPGRTLMFTEGRAFALQDGKPRQIAAITATMMVVRERPDIRPAAASNMNS